MTAVSVHENKAKAQASRRRKSKISPEAARESATPVLTSLWQELTAAEAAKSDASPRSDSASLASG